MYNISRGPSSYQEVKSFLQNDTFRIISYYDIEKVLSIGYEEAFGFFEDSGTNFPEKDVYELFGNDVNKRVRYNDIFLHLIDQLRKNIFEIYRCFQYYFEEFDSYIVTLQDLEALFKHQSTVRINPRMAAINLILRVNGNDHLVTNIHKINIYVDLVLREHDRQVAEDLERELAKEKMLEEKKIENPKWKESLIL
ncbi:hypothetical protein RB653_007894 [Dictyostelium firmibasis]|uniref:Uncharacterized protein n=1 Tax=Dictyostelium firmibasis TaxID=79012 RepID=A0AAN7U1X4_9MYCE